MLVEIAMADRHVLFVWIASHRVGRTRNLGGHHIILHIIIHIIIRHVDAAQTRCPSIVIQALLRCSVVLCWRPVVISNYKSGGNSYGWEKREADSMSRHLSATSSGSGTCFPWTITECVTLERLRPQNGCAQDPMRHARDAKIPSRDASMWPAEMSTTTCVHSTYIHINDAYSV